MKKLLSLLSVLTITGTAVPTTIAASSYQKEEKLNRIKRANEDCGATSFSNKKIVTPALVISDEAEDDSYKKSIKEIINFLLENNIFTEVFASTSSDIRKYSINQTSEYGYFIVPVTRGVGLNPNIALVVRTSDLYIDGFIQINDNWLRADGGIYYYLKDAKIKNITDNKIEINNNTINIDNNTIQLNFEANYSLLVTDNIELTWVGIASAFDALHSFNNNNQNVIKGAIARVALAFSESIRFESITTLIDKSKKENTKFYWQKDVRPIVNEWLKFSVSGVELINAVELTKFKDKDITHTFIKKTKGKPLPNVEDKYKNMSFGNLLEELKNIKVRVIYYLAFLSYCFLYNEYNINSRNKRDINSVCNSEYYVMNNFYEPSGAIFERWNKFLYSNQLKLKMTYSMWKKIDILKQIYNNSDLTFKIKLKKIISGFKEGGNASSSIEPNIDAMVNIIINHYQEINDKIENMNIPSDKIFVIETCGDECWENNINKNVYHY